MAARAPIHPSRSLDRASRRDLVEVWEKYKHLKKDWLRRQIKDNGRVDILAREVLGYQVMPFHARMLQYQFLHPDNLQLVFRGAGKTTLCTVSKAIHLLIVDPNLRIMLASKTAANAEAFLKEIKSHLESNELLNELFGPFFDSGRVAKWDNREIEILPRTSTNKEASITCVGVEGTIVSKHYDIIISDDLIDEENSRTKYMRDKTKTWYYQTLDPVLEPPDAEVPHRGEHHRLGTRYHYDDLYGHLISNELKEHTHIIPALDEHDRSPWPEKYPPEWFKKKEEKSGTIIFRAQYKCDTEAMKGEIFQYDSCHIVDDEEIPKDLRKFIGVDLAVGEKELNDQFAIVVVGIHAPTAKIYVLDYYLGHLRFAKQKQKFLEIYERHDPIRAGIESVAYQKVFSTDLKEEDKDLRITPIYTDTDKVARAWKLSAVFEDDRMHFRRGMGTLIDQIVLFPSHQFDDGFDALDIAVTLGRKKERRQRRGDEPGLI